MSVAAQQILAGCEPGGDLNGEEPENRVTPLTMPATKTSVVLVTVALAGALVAHFTFGLPLGVACLLFFVGWPLGGTLISIDDDLPGGWGDPDGTLRPSWLEAPFWGQICGGLAASAAGFAIDFGWRSSEGLAAWLASAAATFLAAALFTRRWWLLVGTVASIAMLWHGSMGAG